MNRASFTAAIAFSLAILPACSALVPSCQASPRLVSPFGALGTPAPAITIPTNIRSQLPNFVAVRQVLNTHLSPQGERVIIYDTVKDDDAPIPRMAFVTGDKVATILDGAKVSKEAGGFARFQSACEFEAAPHLQAIAFAFTSAGDGSGSAFAIIMWRSGRYQTVFNLRGDQSQLVLGQGRLTIWDSEWDDTCIWCPKHYKISRYSWRDGTFIKMDSHIRKTRFDPAFVSGTPLRK